MLDRFVLNDQAQVLKVTNHIPIRLMNVAPGEIRDLCSKCPLLVYRTDGSDLCAPASPIVIFTERRRQMDNSRTVFCTDEVRGQNLKEIRRLALEVREQRFIPELFGNEF